MANPIEIAVVGHTNAGKTSLIRTLTRRRDFGKVSDSPGTTRAIEMFEIKVDGKGIVQYFDTPGIEDAIYLERHFLDHYNDGLEPLERIDAFLKGPEATRLFEQTAKVLRILRKVDAALYVIDCRDEVLPKFKSEIKLLRDCGKPILPVLNFCRGSESNESQWRETLNAYGLHALIRFDAVAPFVGSESQLYRVLKTQLPNFSANFQEVMDDIEQRYLARRATSCKRIADLLISTAALRKEIDKEDLNDINRKSAFMKSFQEVSREKVRQSVLDLFELYGFGKNDSDVTIAPWMTGRWDSDIFNEKILKDAVRRLGVGLVTGAGLGLLLDVMSAGISMGGGLAIGMSLGGLASQGFGPLSIKLKNKLQGITEVTVEDAVLLVIAENLTCLCRTLEERGHGSVQKVTLPDSQPQAAGETSKEVSKIRKTALRDSVKALRLARAAPDWADPKMPDDSARRRLSNQVEALLLRSLEKDAKTLNVAW